MAISAEPGRKRAYGNDLRWRIIYQRIGMNLSFARIGRNLNIAPSTAHRICKQFNGSGSVTSHYRSERRELRVLNEHKELYIVGLIMCKPSMYLHEVCQEVLNAFSCRVSPSTICRLLKKCGMTRKKIKQVALQRCEQLRGSFMAQCLHFKSNMFVWIDETGSDARNHIRKYGYALRGDTPTTHRLLSRGKRINAVAAICSNGLLTVDLTESTMTGERFFDFVRGSLIPNMLPFNGINPQSIAVLDNCAIHHVQEVKEVFQQAGILLFFLPPYSPDLNPIEEAFSYVKTYLREHDELLQSITNPTHVIQSAFHSITKNLCKSWINHSGYSE